MIKFDQILGNPDEWEFTEKELLEFCSGLKNVSILQGFLNRRFQKMAWEEETYNYSIKKSDIPEDKTFSYEIDEESSNYLDFLDDLHNKDKEKYEKTAYSKKDIKVYWKKLHGLDKKQIFKEDATLFFDWITSLCEEDYKYYSKRINSGERLLSFDKINSIKEDKIKDAFRELLKVINTDFVRVSLNETDKSLVISSTNIDKLNSMVTKLQTLGEAFSQCDYTYKIKNSLTVHYYTFKKI